MIRERLKGFISQRLTFNSIGTQGTVLHLHYTIVQKRCFAIGITFFPSPLSQSISSGLRKFAFSEERAPCASAMFLVLIFAGLFSCRTPASTLTPVYLSDQFINNKDKSAEITQIRSLRNSYSLRIRRVPRAPFYLNLLHSSPRLC